MIGPGAMPRPFARQKKRTLAYTRPRRRRIKNKRVATREPVHHEVVIFDRRAVEFPVATLMPRDARSRSVALIGGLVTWLAARWAVLRPRMVPVLAAGVCTLLVIASVEYLTHPHGTPIYGTVSCTIAHG